MSWNVRMIEYYASIPFRDTLAGSPCGIDGLAHDLSVPASDADSKILQTGMSRWMDGWAARGFS